MPLTPTLMLLSPTWRLLARHRGWSLVPLVRLLPRDATLLAANMQALAWAFHATVRWHELNASPPIMLVPPRPEP
jgi:hypothetical protein